PKCKNKPNTTSSVGGRFRSSTPAWHSRRGEAACCGGWFRCSLAPWLLSSSSCCPRSGQSQQSGMKKADRYLPRDSRIGSRNGWIVHARTSSLNFLGTGSRRRRDSIYSTVVVLRKRTGRLLAAP